MFFGADPIRNSKGEITGYASQTFDSPKYRYIIPMQGNFDLPLEKVKKRSMHETPLFSTGLNEIKVLHRTIIQKMKTV